MDKLTKLEALTGGEARVDPTSETENSWHIPAVKANNIYEGTDSEDDEIIMSRGHRILDEETDEVDYKDGPSSGNTASYFDTTGTVRFDLKQGQLAPEGVRFVSFKTIAKYPYTSIGKINRQKVASLFFDSSKVYGHKYDLFYIYPNESSHNQQPIILIPTKQFEALLGFINYKLKTKLTIPKGAAGDSFYIGFFKDGTLQPRYLGCSSSKEEFETLKLRVPPYHYRHDGESEVDEVPNEESLAAFAKKLALMTAKDKGKKGAAKQKKANDRILRHQATGAVIKRVQKYIGLRETRNYDEAIEAHSRASDNGWVDRMAITAAVAREATEKYGPPSFFDPKTVMKFKPEDSVVFIAVDIEAHEFNHKLITEIGIATLDALDLVKLTPGEGGKNWMQQIRARHFRIEEYKYMINSVHVAGCPDSFEFGKSEFISIQDAPSVVASCFKPPFSGKDGSLQPEDMPKRNIVLVGHALGGDVTFLKDMGYDVTNLSNLQDTVDTADMWKYLKKTPNPTKLGIALYELGLPAWNLHNAGNDAVYTLQVMIGAAIKHIVDKEELQLVGKAGGSSTGATIGGWASDDEGSVATSDEKEAMSKNKENTVQPAKQLGGGGQTSQAGRSELCTGEDKLSKMFEKFNVGPRS